jgi:hypothetical protein
VDHDWISASEDELRRRWGVSILLNFDDDQCFGRFFSDDYVRLCQSPGALRDKSQMFGKAVEYKIRAALDIWSGSGHLYLFEMLEEWDNQDWVKFIKAICIVKGIHSRDLVDTDLNQTIDLMELF